MLLKQYCSVLLADWVAAVKLAHSHSLLLPLLCGDVGVATGVALPAVCTARQPRGVTSHPRMT